ncbi:carbohydrate ABC transporter permease [Gracilibacillus phocaeensis]|uniref:carbohydrate ABC transporter permease n=1 Tax=Gracilibacillus phocaeensis TaxID=2042304 RepID=UPI0010313BEB|nr:sugar ABC transporter permease [Gracilibacillus phocaeensis]
MDRVLKNKTAILIFILPALLVYLLTVFVPIIWSMYLSLFSWDGIFDKIFIGLDNYKKMFLSDNAFWKAYLNNIIFLFIVVSIQIALGLVAAFALTKINKFRNLLKTLYFIPAIVSSVAIAELFRTMYSLNPMGMINYLLGFLGLETLQTAWLSEIETVLVAVSLPEAWRFIGLYMVILYAALLSIPKEVIEAAEIDGANEFKIFRYIKFPLIKPIVLIALVMSITGALKGFDIPFILTGGGPGYNSELLTTYMYNQAFSTMQYGYGSAIAVFIVLQSLIIVGLLRKYIGQQ